MQQSVPPGFYPRPTWFWEPHKGRKRLILTQRKAYTLRVGMSIFERGTRKVDLVLMWRVFCVDRFGVHGLGGVLDRADGLKLPGPRSCNFHLG